MIKAIIFDWIGTLYERDKGLYPYSKRVLQKLKPKYKFGMVSLAKNGVEVRKEEIRNSGILPYFDSVIIDTSKTENHYLECMNEMGVTSKETAIVDDRVIRGIMVGNKLGCETYWIQKGEYANQLPNEVTGNPTHKIDSIKSLLNLI